MSAELRPSNRLRSVALGPSPSNSSELRPGRRPGVAPERSGRLLLLAILLAHIVLGILYSVVVPLWEAYDENGHYAYVQYLRQYRQLPPSDRPRHSVVAGWQPSGYWQLANQPPLYYALGAALTVWVTDDEQWQPEVNRWARDAQAGGYNVFIHTDREAFPYRGTAGAVHLLRLVSVLMSTVTVVLVYLTGRLVFPSRLNVALAATAIVAFAPQFLFVGSMVTNDIALAMFSTSALYFALFALVKRPRWEIVAGFWVSLLCAVLSKTLALYLAPVALLVVVLSVVQSMRRRRKSYLASAAVSLGIALGLIVYLPGNELYFRRALGLAFLWPQGRASPVESLWGSIRRLDQWPYWVGQLWYWFQTFWASFGWGNIGVDEWIYWSLLAVCATASLGCLRALVGRRHRGVTKMAILTLAGILVLTIVAPAFRDWFQGNIHIQYGRYSFAAIPAVGLLLAFGLTRVVPRRLRSPVLVAVATAALVFGVAAPLRYIAPAYATPSIVGEEDLRFVRNRLDFNFDHKIELLGWEADGERCAPGGNLGVTLYWRGLATMEENYTLALKILGSDGSTYGQLHSYPGRGNYVTSRWRVGEIVRDRYVLPVSPQARGQSLARLSVAFLRGDALERLPSFVGSGNRPGGEVYFGRIKVVGEPMSLPETATPVVYRLGQEIALVGYELQGPVAGSNATVRLTLFWRATEEPKDDYTVFVHVLDERGAIVAQRDNQPRDATYPTSLWDRWELVTDEYYLPVPTSVIEREYRIRIGMYQVETGKRLPVYDSGRLRQPEDRVDLPSTGREAFPR